MKTTLKPTLFAVLFLITMSSCNQEDLFVEAIEIVDDTIEKDTQEETQVDFNLPCDFLLDDVEPNSIIIINCVLDLEGQTVNLPDNVTIVYEGGQIINGIINFGINGVIDGDILNSTLTLGGANLQLKDPTFNFNPERWGIVEGEVTQSIAIRNGNILQSIISQSKEMGASTFTIDELDAFFLTEDGHGYGKILDLPSNFNLIMSEKTHLRIFPVSGLSNFFINIEDVENVVVSGGFIHGGRDIGASTDSHLAVIQVRSGVNIKLENINISMAPITGITFNSSTQAYKSDYIPSSNILVTGCTIDSSKRNNLSITDGKDIIVENSTFLNAGVDVGTSLGEAPRYAIIVEPIVRDRQNREQWVENVIVRNCIERGSIKGAFAAVDGNDFTITGNTFEKWVAYNAASNVKIIDNPSLNTVLAGNNSNYARSVNVGNIISGNTFKNSGGGAIVARNLNIEIFNNTMIDCGIGVQIRDLKDSNIYNNTITNSAGFRGDGISILGYADNVMIENNTIDVTGSFTNSNWVNWENDEHISYTFTFKNNQINAGQFARLQGVRGGVFTGNSMDQGLRLDDTQNMLIQGNNIIGATSFSILVIGNKTDSIQLIENNIEAPDQSYGIDIHNFNDASTVNRNIIISKNNFGNALYTYACMYLKGINNIFVSENTGIQENRALIYYRGDNSTFINNISTSSNAKENDIEGNGNIVE